MDRAPAPISASLPPPYPVGLRSRGVILRDAMPMADVLLGCGAGLQRIAGGLCVAAAAILIAVAIPPATATAGASGLRYASLWPSDLALDDPVSVSGLDASLWDDGEGCELAPLQELATSLEPAEGCDDMNASDPHPDSGPADGRQPLLRGHE
jgi:hypothetical protein